MEIRLSAGVWEEIQGHIALEGCGFFTWRSQKYKIGFLMDITDGYHYNRYV